MGSEDTRQVETKARYQRKAAEERKARHAAATLLRPDRQPPPQRDESAAARHQLAGRRPAPLQANLVGRVGPLGLFQLLAHSHRSGAAVSGTRLHDGLQNQAVGDVGFEQIAFGLEVVQREVL